MSRIASNFYRAFALTLPFVVLLAWAECIRVCADDIASHQSLAAVQAEFAGGHGIEAEGPLCLKICPVTGQVTLQERRGVETLAAGPAGEIVTATRYTAPAALLRERPIHAPLPPAVASSLFLRFRNLRI